MKQRLLNKSIFYIYVLADSLDAPNQTFLVDCHPLDSVSNVNSSDPEFQENYCSWAQSLRPTKRDIALFLSWSIRASFGHLFMITCHLITFIIDIIYCLHYLFHIHYWHLPKSSVTNHLLFSLPTCTNFCLQDYSVQVWPNCGSLSQCVLIFIYAHCFTSQRPLILPGKTFILSSNCTRPKKLKIFFILSFLTG